MQGGRPSVSFLGPLGTFSHQVAVREFGESARLLPCETITAVLDQLFEADFDLALVPLSNSSNGPVKETQDYLSRHAGSLRQIRTATVKAEHCLMRRRNASNPPKFILSHEQALGQCRQYLAKNFPEISLKYTDSTAAAAQQASQNSEIAAVCSRGAGQLYNLEMLDEGPEKQGIQDAGFTNETCFGIIERVK